jgi:ABC-type transporter Mla maintaining outer membrane lipid asymmetry permease subunit MlaE
MIRKLQPYLITKWPTVIWSAFVFVLLAIPGNRLLGESWMSMVHLDKLIHAFLFFVLTWLGIYYIQQGKKVSAKILLVWAVITTLYGVVMEFVQIYTGRDFSVGDMVADGVGAFLAAILSMNKK